jgi:hypothetical protein
MDAYRPPQHDVPAPRSVPSVSGSFLFVPRGKKLPHVCLKCASTDKERIRYESKEFRQPTAGEKMGGAGGAVGAVVASQLRHDPALAIMVAAGVGGGVGALVWLASRGSPRATVEIPLCETCLEHIANANSARKMILAGVLGGLGLALFGLLASATVLMVIGGVLFVGGTLYALAAKLPQWQFTTQKVDDDGVTIGGVVPAALTAIAERALKKKKKKKVVETDDESETA